MARTDSATVGKVIEVDPTLTAAVTQAIAAATVIVDRVYTRATAKGVTLSTDELLQIETYLAAHYYALRDPQYISKATDDASATFQGQTGMGLDSTFWGQMAKTLDVSGCLQEQANGIKRPKMGWLGSDDQDLPSSDL